MNVSDILDRSLDGQRITKEEGEFLYNNASLHELGQAANHIRNKRWDRKEVTFVIDRNINYTNICNVDCKFCAFYRKPNADDVYTLDKEEILRKVGELVDIEGTQLLLQGGLNAKIKWDYYIEMLSAIRDKYPTVDIHSFSPTEIEFFAKIYHKTEKQVFEELRDAGLKSFPGGGSEILVDRVREIVSPHKTSAKRWIELMDIAQSIGMKTSATMTYGHFETIAERMEHFDLLRVQQDKYNGFTAFIPWSMQPENTDLQGKFDKSTASEYLRMIAISRIMLDNIPSIQAGWVTEGIKPAQMALFYGANDFGGILMEENVVSATGVTYWTNISQMLHMIRQAGFIPVQRNTYYEKLRVFDDPKNDPTPKENPLRVIQ